MNPGWWSAIIATAVAVTGWAAFMARLVWIIRGVLDKINDSQSKLEQHLAWHWQKGDSHALFDGTRQRARKPRVQADREPGHRADLLLLGYLRPGGPADLVDTDARTHGSTVRLGGSGGRRIWTACALHVLFPAARRLLGILFELECA